MTVPEWDLADKLNPQPTVWPICPRDDCQTPWVYRQAFAFRDGQLVPVWSWMRDCKHKLKAGELPEMSR